MQLPTVSKFLKSVLMTTLSVIAVSIFGLNLGSLKAQVVPAPVIIDDSDKVNFIPEGQTDNAQPTYWSTTTAGYKGGAIYTGNSVNKDRHNWGTWTAPGLTGTLDVSVTIPGGTYFSEKGNVIPLTSSAYYKVTYAGGEKTVKVDQKANLGKTVSLGSFAFNGTGSVYLSDIVDETGKFFLSAVVFDSVIFGGSGQNLDLIPPVIENVKPVAYQGSFIIEAKITDNVAVAEASLFFNGVEYKMIKGKNDIYSSPIIPFASNKNIEYYIVAKDTSGNTTPWSSKRGYISRGALISSLGFTPGILVNKYKYLNSNQVYDAACGCDVQWAADPVNPVNGNLLTQEKIFLMPGRPEVDFHLTYNSQGNSLSIFGQNWVHSYQYHLIELDNATIQATFVQYPDGAMVKFNGSNFDPEPGRHEKLTRDGSGYILTFTDLSKVKFDADGDITRWEDANGNGINFTYGDKNPYTLMSQLKSIKADGGREITLAYNGDGLVQSMTAPEGKTITFEYASDNLVKINDANGGHTTLEYNNQLLTKETSPNGSVKMANTYDDQNRVISQSSGAAVKFDFAYSNGQTVNTDANGKRLTYKFSNEVVTNVIDQAGKASTYEYDANKNLISYTDRDGNKYSYGYDANGNKVYEKDPMGSEVKRTFDTNFNKVLTEIYKQADHVTRYDYDAKGNVLKITNANGYVANYTYTAQGQVSDYSDFNGHNTHYTYTGAGDVESVKDGANNTANYAYDGFGRKIKLTNPRGFSYNYAYDKNDNLVQISGPLNYVEKFGYDANSLMVSHTNGNTNTEFFTYDASGNMVKAKDFMGFETNYTFGKMNEKLSKVDPMGRTTQYTNDDTYRVIQVKQAVGTADEVTISFTHNLDGNNTSQTDPNNILSKFDLDPLNRVKKIIDNANGNAANSENNVATNYEYSPTDQVVKVIDADGNATVYTYDKLDRLIKKVDAENLTTSYEYDGEGNLVKETNPRNFATVYEYDGANRLVKVTDAKNGVTKTTYDGNGNIDTQTDANGVVTKFVYDELDRNTVKFENFVSGGASDAKTNVTTKYGYDLNGNVTTEINPRTFPTTKVYDADDRLVNIKDALNNVTELSYDKAGNLLAVKDRNAHLTSFAYDNLDRMTKSVDPEGHTTVYSYDKNGNLIGTVDPRGKKYSQNFDPLNRVKVAVDPYSKTKVYTYDAQGNILSSTDENAHTSTYQYDKVYRLKKVTDAENFSTAYEYDQNGNVTKQIDGNNNPTAYVYDELDRLTSTTDAENEVEQYAYDALKNKTLLTQADGTQHKFNYDPLYRLTEVIDNFKPGKPSTNDTNVSTKYLYDANGNLTKEIDALSHATVFDYDQLDRKVTETNALGKQWKYNYDNEANILKRTDAIGVVTQYAYYADDQLKQIQYPSYKVDYTYDQNHNVLSMQDNLGKSSWSYDDLNRMTAQTDPYNRKLGYQYDPIGNLTKLTYPDQRNMAYNYMKNNWLSQAQSSDNDKVQYTRNGVGLTTKLTKSNSSTSTITYDKVYRKLGVVDQQVGGANQLIDKFDYKYNLVGDITTENADYGIGQFKKINSTYSYDGLHRLVKADSTDSQSSIYEYDSVGNRTKMQEYIPAKKAYETRTYSYNEINSLTNINIDSPMPPNKLQYKYQYDANGNRIDTLRKDATGIDRGTHYTYDTENRLTKAQDYMGQIGKGGKALLMAHTDMEYDGNGRRLSSTYYPGSSPQGDRTEFTFDKLDPIVESHIKDHQRSNFYRDTDQNLLFNQEFKSENAPSGTSYWYSMDGKGNIATVDKASAQSDHSYKYDEYGAAIPDSGKWDAHNNTFTLSQKEYDNNTGLDYFGARFYEPSTGTWMTQDSYRGDITKPNTLHRYMYNLDSPVSNIDKYGYSVLGDAWNAAQNAVSSTITTVENTYNSAKDYYDSSNRLQSGVQIASSIAGGAKEILVNIPASALVTAGGIVTGQFQITTSGLVGGVTSIDRMFASATDLSNGVYTLITNKTPIKETQYGPMAQISYTLFGADSLKVFDASRQAFEIGGFISDVVELPGKITSFSKGLTSLQSYKRLMENAKIMMQSPNIPYYALKKLINEMKLGGEIIGTFKDILGKSWDSLKYLSSLDLSYFRYYDYGGMYCTPIPFPTPGPAPTPTPMMKPGSW